MANCVLCGCEVSFLSQKVIHFCSTEQPLCGDCWKQYDRSDKVEQGCLRDRILASPHLRKREKVLAFVNENRTNLEKRARDAESEKQRLESLIHRMRQVLRCCDTPMNYLGPGSYRQAADDLFPPPCERYVTVFECPVCGQVKFFNQDFVPAALRKKEGSDD